LAAGCASEVSPASGAAQGSEQAASQSEALSLTDPVVSLDHHLLLSNGATIHVKEKFTLKSLARPQRRALMMLTGTLVTNAQYDFPAPYDALARAARAGFFAFSPTYEGYGESSHPDSGLSVTKERLLPEMGEIVEWIRHHRLLRRVDLMGASLGSSMAYELGSIHSPINRRHIGKLILTANVYKNVTPLFQSVFFTPEFHDLLLNVPNGYLPTPPQAYGLILLQAEPDAQAFGFATFPGVYATGPTLEGFNLPSYPAQDGRAPVLQFLGDMDPITPLSDAQQFQAEYGGEAHLSILPGGGHAPYYEPVKETFWQQAFGFLNVGGDCWEHGFGDGCGDAVVGESAVQELSVAATAAPLTASAPSDSAFVPYAW
jgi:pimeloyl-ACP methyl ester carboxylesterase